MTKPTDPLDIDEEDDLRYRLSRARSIRVHTAYRLLATIDEARSHPTSCGDRCPCYVRGLNDEAEGLATA